MGVIHGSFNLFKQENEMNTIDLNKPLRFVQPNGGGGSHPTELVVIAGQDFFVQGLSKNNYWRCHADGTIEHHGNWRIENAPPPSPVTYTATVVWIRCNSNQVDCLSFRNPVSAHAFQVSVGECFISKQDIEITV